MKIRDILAEEKPTLSFEVFPPKTADNYQSVETAALKIAQAEPAFMSVTYGAGGGTSQYTVQIASTIKNKGNVTPLAHLQDLSTNPESITNRKLFITQAESFLEKAQNVYSALKSYQVNLNSQIESQVTSINKIADQIAELNTKISAAEASGLENANDYRDARNLLLDQLAEYTNYDYYEDSTGQVNVRINNAPLVDESRSYHMACKNIKNQKYDEATGTYTDIESSPMYTVVWEKNGYGEVYDINRALYEQ